MSKRRSSTRTGTRPGDDQVHKITSTQAPLGEDIDRRARRYLAQMAVRTVCFLGAVVTWGVVPAWVSGALLVGAVVLPYVAVVLANAGRERPDRADSLMELRQIGGAPRTPPLAPPAHRESTHRPPPARTDAPGPVPDASTGPPRPDGSRT